MTERQLIFRDVIEDESGRKRFVENRIVRQLKWAAQSGEQFDLNDAWGGLLTARWTLIELKEFYQLIGYSLDGYWEVFGQDIGEAGASMLTAEDKRLLQRHGLMRTTGVAGDCDDDGDGQ